MRILSTVLASLALIACDDSNPSTTPAPSSDAGASEASADDASSSDVDVAPPDATPDAPGPLLLSAQGLYQDIGTKTVVAEATEFVPAYPLWSDGTTKRRWILLPAGAVIDTSDMDHWQLPVGTKFFKEFSLGGKRIETRIIERKAATGQVGVDWFFGAFVWREDESDAEFAPTGLLGARATTHDVPSQAQCNGCHGGDVAFVLGFAAIQLSKPGAPPTLKSLADAGKLSAVPDGGADFPVPGNATQSAALGALHANCGHCHQPGAFAYDETHMVLRISASEKTPAQTQTYLTTVGVALDKWVGQGFASRIVAGKPAESAVMFRMTQRGSNKAMPPLATKIVDDAGAAAVSAWISSL